MSHRIKRKLQEKCAATLISLISMQLEFLEERRGKLKTFEEKKKCPNFKYDKNYKPTVLRNSMNSKHRQDHKTKP